MLFEWKPNRHIHVRLISPIGTATRWLLASIRATYSQPIHFLTMAVAVDAAAAYNAVASKQSNYKIFLPPRDLTGYGLEQPTGEIWPNGAKIAVSFVLNYEEGAEHSVWNGDAHSEQFLNEAGYWRLRQDGRRDMYTESMYVSLGVWLSGRSLRAAPPVHRADAGVREGKAPR